MYNDNRKMQVYGRTNPRDGSPKSPVPMAATQAISGGKFVYMNAGAATLCTDASTTIFGFLETHDHTPSTGKIISCDVDLSGIFRIPVTSGTFAVGMIGDYCDLDQDADGVQGATLDASVRNLVIIVDGDLENNLWVDVMMNPAVWGTLLGADA